MPAQVSTNLLASYIAAAARQVLNETSLTDRSRWAIAHARRQLEDARDILVGEKPVTEGSPRAALRTGPPAGGPSLAALVLRSGPVVVTDVPITERERLAADRLSAVIEDLLAVTADVPDTRAAERLGSVFSRSDSVAA
jgi:hypothetical protein